MNQSSGAPFPRAALPIINTPMADWPHLSNAPITEALLDIQVRLPSDTKVEGLAIIHDSIRERYPTPRTRMNWKGGIQIKEGEQPQVVSPEGGPTGYLFYSADNRRVVQVRLDGFTFNQHRPYLNWATFRDEAREHWNRYRDLAKPEMVTRIALRFINRLDIPEPMGDFKNYILTAPDLAPGLPQGLANFFMRLAIPHPTEGYTALVTMTEDAPTKAGVASLILDVDVFQEMAVAPSNEAIWGVFEQLRDYKNEVFFKSLTPKAIALFQ